MRRLLFKNQLNDLHFSYKKTLLAGHFVRIAFWIKTGYNVTFTTPSKVSSFNSLSTADNFQFNKTIIHGRIHIHRFTQFFFNPVFTIKRDKHTLFSSRQVVDTVPTCLFEKENGEKLVWASCRPADRPWWWRFCKAYIYILPDYTPDLHTVFAEW